MSKKEKRISLYQELREYEETKEMTTGERRGLYKWVKQGNSVYSNPELTTYEDGSEMDFIDGFRIEAIIAEEMRSLSSEQLLVYHRQQQEYMIDLLSAMTRSTALCS